MFGKKGTGSHYKEGFKSKPPVKREDEQPKPFAKKAPHQGSDSIKKSLRLRTIEKNTELNKPEAVNDYEVKPRYSSLSDYLDKNPMKQSEKSTEKTYDKKPSYKPSSNEKSSAKSSQAGEDSQKRGPSSGNSGGSGKTRFKQSGRKNKSR